MFWNQQKNERFKRKYLIFNEIPSLFFNVYYVFTQKIFVYLNIKTREKQQRIELKRDIHSFYLEILTNKMKRGKEHVK